MRHVKIHARHADYFIPGVILGNQTIKRTLLNFSRSTVFTAAPAFHQIAAIRAGYTLMPQPESDLVSSRDRWLSLRITNGSPRVAKISSAW